MIVWTAVSYLWIAIAGSLPSFQVFIAAHSVNERVAMSHWSHSCNENYYITYSLQITNSHTHTHTERNVGCAKANPFIHVISVYPRMTGKMLQNVIHQWSGYEQIVVFTLEQHDLYFPMNASMIIGQLHPICSLSIALWFPIGIINWLINDWFIQTYC